MQWGALLVTVRCWTAPTKACVQQLYSDTGYQTVGSSTTEAAELDAAHNAVVDAQDALALGEITLQSNPNDPAQQLSVDQQRRAEETERRLVTTRSGVGPDHPVRRGRIRT